MDGAVKDIRIEAICFALEAIKLLDRSVLKSEPLTGPCSVVISHVLWSLLSVADTTKLSATYKPLTQQFIEYQKIIQRREHLIERTAIAGIYGGARTPSVC